MGNFIIIIIIIDVQMWNGEKLVAKWNILQHLFLFESSGLLKLSKLTEKSVFPKPIEELGPEVY